MAFGLLPLAISAASLMAAAAARGKTEKKLKKARGLTKREAGKVTSAEKAEKKAKKKAKKAAAIAKREAKKAARAKQEAKKARRAAKAAKPEKKKKKKKAKKKPAGKDGYKVSLTDAEKKKRKKKKKLPKPESDKKKKKKKAKKKRKGKKGADISAKSAAQQLYSYVTRTINAGNVRMLGSKGKPNKEVERLQEAMGKIKSDGIYGPATRARGRELIGREYPTRTGSAPKPDPKRKAAPAPDPKTWPSGDIPEDDDDDDDDQDDDQDDDNGRSAIRAAGDLWLYVDGLGTRGRAKALGYRGRPNQIVLTAQEDMGGIATDGIYGPGTRARGKELTGKTFKPR